MLGTAFINYALFLNQEMYVCIKCVNLEKNSFVEECDAFLKSSILKSFMCFVYGIAFNDYPNLGNFQIGLKIYHHKFRSTVFETKLSIYRHQTIC